MSVMETTPTLLPQNQWLGRNPQLPQTPMGQYTDAMYEAQVAMLRNQVAKQYADLLQQLGYANEQGQFVPGSVEADARRQKRDLEYSKTRATEEVTNQAQREGTLFSGRRASETAKAQHPFVQQAADLDVSVPLTLSKLYEQASGLSHDFVLQNNLLLSEAAARAAERARGAGYDSPGGGGSSGGVGASALTAGTEPYPPTSYTGGLSSMPAVLDPETNLYKGGYIANPTYTQIGGAPTTPPTGSNPNWNYGRAKTVNGQRMIWDNSLSTYVPWV